MALTRAGVENVLIRRCGALMTWANLDGVTVDGTNEDLADPIWLALTDCEVTPAALTPVDGDFATLATADNARFLAIAELRCLETVWGNIAEVTEKMGTDQQSWNEAKRELRQRLGDLRSDLARKYGYGEGSLGSGTFRLEYVEPDPDA